MTREAAEPVGSLESIQFEDLFEVEEIQRLQDSFAAATGVASIITRTDGTPITRPSRFCHLCLNVIRKTERGLANCMQSDAHLGQLNPGGPRVQRCLSAGLYDGGTTLRVGEHPIAYWLIGQVLDETIDCEEIVTYVRSIGGDPEEARRALEKVTRMSKERFEHVSQLHFLMAQQLSRLAIQNVQQRREIAARRRAEAEREALQSQLVQSQKMEAVGRLAGGVAHDFNNILTGMSGYAELAQDGLPPQSETYESLAEIRRGIDRATELTRQLLAFSRRQTIQPTVVSLNEVIARSQRLLARIIGEDVELRFVTAPDLGWTRVDPGQVEQILVNLAVNARDAMEGGGVLEVSTSNVASEAGPFVCLKVSDTGCGMDEETQRHLFEPFFTTKPVGRGTGLGLATAYGIVQQNGGHITVRSEPGKGSTFCVHFPQVEAPAASTAPAPLAPPRTTAKPAAAASGAGPTVLVVEDDATVRQLAQLALSRSGYRVLVACDAAQAVAIAERPDVALDLLLTDVVMPGQSGREVCREVLSRHPDALVLFMSGYTDDHLGRHGVLDYRVPFLAKPFSVEALESKVREVLERREAVPWDALGGRPAPRPKG
ncbi:MAG: PocR ligand-binding domain-containing protein [Myxococcales bacterium]